MWNSVWQLVKKDIRLEFRNRATLGSLLLYLVSTIFICYQSFREITQVPVWTALLWIIFLFTGVNSVTKSFLQENRAQQIYYYTLARPEAVILAKMIYNAILLLVLNLAGYILYTGIFGSSGVPTAAFFPFLFLGILGISNLLTFVSAIASKTTNSTGIVAVLSFPLIMPLLLTLIGSTIRLGMGVPFAETLKYLYVLGGLNIVIITLSYILFPYLWRE